MSSTDTTTDPRIDAIAEQRRRQQECRDRETRELARLIAEATTGDDSISYTQAGEAMGLSKTYAHKLAADYRAGRL